MAAAPSTDVRAMFDKKYLGAWDLAAGDLTLTISRVRGEQLQNEGGKQKKPVVYFEGEEKQLALNKTMAKTIAGLYGNDTRKWVGRQITVYATTTKFGRETVDCVRVRPHVPHVPKGPSGKLPDVPVDEEMRERQQTAARQASADESPGAAIKAAKNADEMLEAIRLGAAWISEKPEERWPWTLKCAAKRGVKEADAELALQLGRESA